MRKGIRRISVLILLLGLLASALSAWAQGTLPEDQRALLDKAAAAVNAADEYDSYVTDDTTVESQTLQILSGGQIAQEQVSVKNTESHKIIVRGENVAALYTATVTGEENGNAYTVEGELRYVDDILYGSATYTPADPTQPALFNFAEGFSVIEDPSAAGDFDILGPQSLVDDVLLVSTGPFDDPEKLASVTDSVTSEEGELDGVKVEIITINIGFANIINLIAETSDNFDPEDPTTAAIFSLISEDSFGTITVYLDEDGNPLQGETRLTVIVDNADMSAIDPSAAGFTLSLTAENSLVTRIHSVNAVKDAITAPE